MVSTLVQDTYTREEIAALLARTEPAEVEALRLAAVEVMEAYVGPMVYYRGIVELSNVCVLDCHYCGIRKGNRKVERYTLDKAEILEAAQWCAEAGYGSAVLQAGERRDEAFVAFIEDVIREIKARTVSAALPQGLGLTLSLGEQSQATYDRWFAAGGHRYLLRVETTNPDLYRRIHPEAQTLEDRIGALRRIRRAGMQVGTGVMIGLPGQTLLDLADDLRFFRDMDVDMIGMGPYITHPDTPMSGAGMLAHPSLLQLALNMIAVARLVLKDVNIASTTALQALVPDGRERGLAYGANVTMPNLTPREVRKNYQLYEGKPCVDEAKDDCKGCLLTRVHAVGRDVAWNQWGDPVHARRRARA